MIVTPALAADMPALPPLTTKAAPIPDLDYFAAQPSPAIQYEVAGRYWYGIAKTGKSLYGTPDAVGMVSRLTYSNMSTSSGEIEGRISSTFGWFVKGYAGIGRISSGTLRDEDFPVPGTGLGAYSSTNSDQRGGYLDYASMDVGYNFVRGGDFSLGAFAGYHFFNEVVDAYGCSQAATNTDVCFNPTYPSGYEVITQDNKWSSLRVGLNGSVTFADRFKLSVDAAYLPYVLLSGNDAHLLRIGSAVGDFNGAIPDKGTGQGYQFEALLSYQLTPSFGIGIGGRYWHMQASGLSHFEGRVVGEDAVAQPVDWKTDIYGMFVQASYKFGPYPIN